MQRRMQPSRTQRTGRVLLRGLALAGLVTALAACAPALQSSAQPGNSAVSTLRPAVSGEQRFLTLPGFGRVGYYADPRGSGRPVILTHAVNAAASAYEVRPLWNAYAGQRPVYALEWPGFGQSDRPDVTYAPELMTQALLALVAELNTEVDVVALSLGSEFAARAALQEPRIRSLALISPSGLGQPRGGSQQATADDGGQSRYQRLRRVDDLLYGTLRTRPSIHYFLSRSFRKPVPGEVIDYSVDTSRQPGAKYAPLYFVSGRLFDRDGYQNLYRPLKTPTLVLYDQDGFVSFERLPLFAQQPGVQAVRIAGTDGLPHWEKLAEVRAALDTFWQRQ